MERGNGNRVMKTQLFVALCLFTGVLTGQEPRVRTIETELPVVPEGIAAATYPMPRTEWVVNVRNMIADGQKVAGTTRLILDGDSINAGWRRFWRHHFSHIPTYNFAMSGDRTQHLLWRLEQGQVENMKPEVILLMIGTNNLGNGESVEDTIAGIQAVVDAYRKRFPDAVIYLHGLLPRSTGSFRDTNNVWAQRIQKVNQGVSSLADGKNVFFLDVNHVFLMEDGTINREYMADLLHPTEKGYAAWAEVLRPVLDSLQNNHK